MTKIDTLQAALKPFADLMPWLESETEIGPDGEIWGTRDEDRLLEAEGIDFRSRVHHFVTAGMIRQARAAMELTDGN